MKSIILSSELMRFIADSNIKGKLLCVSLTLIYLSATQLITVLLLHETPKHQKADKKIPIYHIAVFTFSATLLLFFGWSMKLIQGTIFMLLLLYASVCDIQTHEVKNFVSLVITVTGFIEIEFSQVSGRFLSALVLGGMLFVCAVVSKNRLGGADVKLTAACAMVLGLQKSVAGLVVGLALAILCNLCFSRKPEKKGKAFPLVPYLSVGFMITYLI